MATSLDLEEQEQLDQLKHFWRTYGNLITWTITLCLAAYAGWMGWQWWQRDQAAKAGGMFGELDRAVQVGDLGRSAKVFADLQERFPSTTYTAQGALLTARLQFDKGQVDAARGTLGWAAEKGVDAEYRTVAKLRLAGVLMDQKKYDEAEAVRARYIPLEDCRDGISPIRVLHDAVTLAGVADMGPMLPMLTGLEPAERARVEPVAKALLAVDGGYAG